MPDMTEFIHLHTHSDYSLLDGAASVTSLIGRARELNMSHLALTDHGNLFGAMKFYKECQRNSIIPIIGSEFYVAPGSRFIKTGGDNDIRYTHLVLLAADEQGYRNLLELSSRGYTEGFYYKPRIDRELLEQYSEGLICLSGCISGEIPRLVLSGREEEAEKRAHWYNELFGPDHFYLELQDHGIAEEKTINNSLLLMAQRTGIPIIATNDIHYTFREDARAQDILICIGTNKKVTDGKRLKFTYPEFYFKTGAEMAALFQETSAALRNTIKVAEMCQVKVPLPGPQFPEFSVPDGYTAESYLRELAFDGLKQRYDNVSSELKERLDYELSMICPLGFTDYFLITWDFVRFARERKIPVGPGRGSGAGSLVAYSLKITDIDPIEYGLFFERFLNPERVSLPDFDIDFCFERRGEVINYVSEKYGQDRVGQIITFGTLGAKAAIRDVARVLDFSYAEADRIAKLVPEGPKVSLRKSLETDPELAKLQQQNGRTQELFDTSKKLEGLCRHASTHAAGVVVGREPLTHYVPLYRDAKTGSVSTQFTMDFLEECGLVKMDFLGLKTLTIIQKTEQMICERGLDFSIVTIPNNDPAAFKLLGEGRSRCVFQFESSGMQGILKRAKPSTIQDLSALSALYRPGPMDNIDQYIDSKTGRKPISYILPELKNILEETCGVIIYQEQVMQIARKVSGYTLGQADMLRKAMGKKKPEVMAEQKQKFIKGALAKGYTKKMAEDIFELLIPFAGYGFPKGHSVPYALLAYQTAYLKANYPAEFMAANLSSVINDTDKLGLYIAEAREMGIEILRPNLNLSESDFSVVESRIIYGLCGIKNVGYSAAQTIINERIENGKFKTIHEFLERIDLKIVNRKVVEALILAGVLDGFGQNRATLFHNLDQLLEMASRSAAGRAYGQESLFADGQIEIMMREDLEKVEEWPKVELLRLEKQNLGFFFSGHPLDGLSEQIASHVNLNLSKLANASSEREHTLIGSLKDLKEILTRKGRKMAFGTLEDFNGSIELVIFPDIFEKHNELLENDNVIAVKGKIDKSRGEPKLIVDRVMAPDNLPKKKATSIHIRFAEKVGTESELYQLREFILGQTGKCPLYLHINDHRTRERIIRASSAITVSADRQVLEGMMNYPNIVEVWEE